jgi:hypothetical protein
MNNTRVIKKEGKFVKDKSSERRDSILPEETTHYGDAMDKWSWTKYGTILYKVGGSTFVSPRIYNNRILFFNKFFKLKNVS